MGSYFPDQGLNPYPCSGVEAQNLNHWTIFVSVGLFQNDKLTLMKLYALVYQTEKEEEI